MAMANIKNIVTKDVNDLIFAEYNPRQLTESQFKHLKDSIERFGLVDPIIINKNKDRKNIIIGGHQRARVAKSIGIDKIPCIELNLSYEKERELNIRLNKNVGSWDYDVLANTFDIEELKGWGFEDFDIGDLGIDVDESALDDYDIDDKINEMEGLALKSVMIPIRNEMYEEIKMLLSDYKDKKLPVDSIFLDALKKCKK
mgnify:CR=1 FL=1|tara:strand:+ start:2217 stop:2816 length:600 start_codon:yes stop_codon:yes gene_type:complete